MKLIIKDPIPAIDNPTNIYRIHIKSMHGDADAYTEQQEQVVEVEEVINYIKFLSTVWTMTGDEYNDNEVRKAVREAAVELNYKAHGEDLFMDLVEMDQTRTEGYAAVDEIWITYFNLDGIEFKVDIDLGGKVYPSINKYRYTGNRF